MIPRRTHPAPHRRGAVAAVVLLGLALTGCAGADGRTDPGRLSHTTVERVVTDRVVETTLTVHGVVTDFPAPDGSASDARLLVLVDVTLSAGDVLETTTGPGDFALRPAAGDERPADTSAAVSVALTDATLWPLEELPGGRSQRGWLAFPATGAPLEETELVLRRPEQVRASDDDLARGEVVVRLVED